MRRQLSREYSPALSERDADHHIIEVLRPAGKGAANTGMRRLSAVGSTRRRLFQEQE